MITDKKICLIGGLGAALIIIALTFTRYSHERAEEAPQSLNSFGLPGYQMKCKSVTRDLTRCSNDEVICYTSWTPRAVLECKWLGEETKMY